MWKSIILDVECIVCNKSLQKINHNPEAASRKMGKIIHRRSRSANWSVDEKKCLLDLIQERRAVITRATNGPTHNEEKDLAWNEILRELAKRFGNKFSGSCTKRLKTQWQNMKRIAREEMTLNGPALMKYSSQSLAVCNILELIKDGVLVKPMESANSSSVLNETVTCNDLNSSLNSISNIEVKTERIDEDQPTSIARDMDTDKTHEQAQKQTQNDSAQSVDSNHFESSSSISENSEMLYVAEEHDHLDNCSVMKTVAANTEPVNFDDNLNPFYKDYQGFKRFTTAERQIKMEALKEERQIVRAMRETAELNKIIAEQRLKHVLWVKKKEMAMYSGEPGSGAGKGGGGGGAIREAGGTFGKMEAAREDEYFYKQQKQQIENLKKHIDKEVAFHQEQIKRHEDAIRRHKQTVSEMEKK